MSRKKKKYVLFGEELTPFEEGARLRGNMGVEIATPVLARFSSPVAAGDKTEKRWSDGLYLDQPEEWDNPYRAFRW